MADTIARRVWRFSDGSEIEFRDSDKAITNHGGGLAVGAILCVRDQMPDLMRACTGQEELDRRIIAALDKLIK